MFNGSTDDVGNTIADQDKYDVTRDQFHDRYALNIKATLAGPRKEGKARPRQNAIGALPAANDNLQPDREYVCA